MWIQGRIEFERGNFAESEAILKEVREYLAEEVGSLFGVANVSLDIALIYLAQGRWTRLTETAAFLTSTYKALDVGTEAMAAMRLLRDAVRARTLSEATVEYLRSFCEELERDRTKRFVAPPREPP